MARESWNPWSPDASEKFVYSREEVLRACESAINLLKNLRIMIQPHVANHPTLKAIDEGTRLEIEHVRRFMRTLDDDARRALPERTERDL